MVSADSDGEHILVTCDTHNERDLVSLVSGSKWRENRGYWECNLSWSNAKQLRSIFGESLILSDTLTEWGYQELEQRITPSMELRELLSIEDPEMDPRLRPYQRAGAKFLVTAGQAILGDPPGSGKTATAITAARSLGETLSLPALIVTPKSVMESWKREVNQWWPGIPVYAVDGKPAKRNELILKCQQEKAFCVINFDAVRLHSRLAPYGSTRMRHCVQCDRTSNNSWSQCERCPKELNMVDWKSVIVDEGHRIANISKQTRGIWHIGTNVPYKWVLTGTPLTKNIDTIWPLLHFLAPSEWPSKVQFLDRYALMRPIPWGSGSEVIGMSPANEEEFQEIFQPRFRRMPKEIILPQLPPVQRIRRYLEMGDKQRRLYDQMVEDMVAETESGELLIAQNPAVKMLRMVQFSSACVDMIPTEEGEPKARLTDPSNKLDALMEDLPDLLAAEESILVFAVSRQLIEMAEERLKEAKISYSVIKGNQKPFFRQAQIDDFQNEVVKVILVVISAGGTGVNLQQGRIGIFLQRAWDFVSNHQAEGRYNRIGSEKHAFTQVIDYISRGTADEAVIRVAAGKEIQLERVVRDREAIRRLLRGEDPQEGTEDS